MVRSVEGSSRTAWPPYWNACAPISSRPSLQSIRPIWALKNAPLAMELSVEGNFT